MLRAKTATKTSYKTSYKTSHGSSHGSAIRLHHELIPIIKASISSRARHSNTAHQVHLLRPKAGEKKEPEFYPAKIESIETACSGGVFSVTIDNPKARQNYQKPGQYAQMRVGDSKPGFFALANKPGDNKLEFLIKKVDGTAGLITDLAPGDHLEMTDVMGKGFPWENVADNDKYNGGTYVFATGTGFGPIKALIENGTFKGRSNLKIYYGAKDSAHMPFYDKFQDWFDQGLLGVGSDVPIIPVFSCEPKNGEGKGYVQDVAVIGGNNVDPQTASAIICGHWDMTNVLKEKLGDFGMPKENILTNF